MLAKPILARGLYEYDRLPLLAVWKREDINMRQACVNLPLPLRSKQGPHSLSVPRRIGIPYALRVRRSPLPEQSSQAVYIQSTLPGHTN